jgi:hypothetical protein
VNEVSSSTAAIVSGKMRVRDLKRHQSIQILGTAQFLAAVAKV